MKKALLFIVLLLASCDKRVYFNEPDQHEEGLIVETLHIPRQEQHDINLGMTVNGDLAITPSSVVFPERWTVVVKCQHGKFILDSERHDIAKGIWENVTVGDKVDIIYHEIKTWVEDSDGKKIVPETLFKYQTTEIRKIK